jgi:hypothetical protein
VRALQIAAGDVTFGQNNTWNWGEEAQCDSDDTYKNGVYPCAKSNIMRAEMGLLNARLASLSPWVLPKCPISSIKIGGSGIRQYANLAFDVENYNDLIQSSLTGKFTEK